MELKMWTSMFLLLLAVSCLKNVALCVPVMHLITEAGLPTDTTVLGPLTL